MNERPNEEKKVKGWDQECDAFENRISRLKALCVDLPDFGIVGGELDQLPSGFAASVLFENGGSVLCVTAHSLTAEKAQVLVFQDLNLWLRFIANETE